MALHFSALLLLPTLACADQLGFLCSRETCPGKRKGTELILQQDGIRFANGKQTKKYLSDGREPFVTWITVHDSDIGKAVGIELGGLQGSVPLPVADWFPDSPSGKARVRAKRVELSGEDGKASDTVIFVVRVEDNHRDTWQTFWNAAMPILEGSAKAPAGTVESDLEAAWRQAYHNHDENQHYVIVFGGNLQKKAHSVKMEFLQASGVHTRERTLGGENMDAAWCGTSVPMADSDQDQALRIDVDGMEALPKTELPSAGSGAVRCKVFAASPGGHYASWFVAAFDQKFMYDAFRKGVERSAAYIAGAQEWDNEILMMLCAAPGGNGELQPSPPWENQRSLPNGLSTSTESGNALIIGIVLTVGVLVVLAIVCAWHRGMCAAVVPHSMCSQSSKKSYRSMGAPSICGGTWEGAAEPLGDEDEVLEMMMSETRADGAYPVAGGFPIAAVPTSGCEGATSGTISDAALSFSQCP